MVLEDIENNHNGNGNHEDISGEAKPGGAFIDLAKLKRGEPLFYRNTQAHQSLLHRVISAISDNKEYRNELKTALFASADEADDAVAALDECRELGMDSTVIIDQIIARSAGKNHALLSDILAALTSSTYKIQNTGSDKKHDRPKSNSPLS